VLPGHAAGKPFTDPQHPLEMAWPDPVNWSTTGESRSLVGTGGSVADWR
jgi:hypothetical protein